MQKTYIPFGFAQFGYAIFSHALPLLILIEFGLGPREIGILNMVVSFFSMLGIAYWSRWIDKHEERRGLVSLGFCFVGIAAIIGIFTENYYLLIIVAAILGFFFSIFGMVGSTLVVQETWGTYKQRLKNYNIVISTATLVALASAAFFLHYFKSEFGLRLLLFAVFSAFAFGLAFTPFLPAKSPHKPMLSKSELIKINTGIFERLHYLPSKIAHKPRFANVDRRIYWICLGFSAMLFGFSAFNTVLPAFLFAKGISGTGIFAVHLSSAIACTVGYLRVSKIKADRLLEFSTAARIWIIGCFSLLFFLPPSIVLIAAIVVNGLMGLCWAGISSASVRMVMRFTESYHTGSVMGIYHLSLSAGTATGALIGGHLFDALNVLAYPLFALVVANGLLLAISWYKTS